MGCGREWQRTGLLSRGVLVQVRGGPPNLSPACFISWQDRRRSWVRIPPAPYTELAVYTAVGAVAQLVERRRIFVDERRSWRVAALCKSVGPWA